jgi:hypothetical protein
MTIGALFRNGANSVQIGSDYANHALLTSGAYNLPTGNDVSITVAATAPIIALTGNWPVSIFQTSRSGPNWTFDLMVQANPTNAVGNYYIFDTVQPGSQKFPASIGIELFDPITGLPTYRSDLKYLRIVSLTTMDMPGPVKTNGPISQASGRAGLAAVIANPGGRVVAHTISVVNPDGTRGDSTEWTPYQLAAAVNDTTLVYGSNDTRFTSQNEGNDQLNVPCTLMLIDISNF